MVEEGSFSSGEIIKEAGVATVVGHTEKDSVQQRTNIVTHVDRTIIMQE